MDLVGPLFDAFGSHVVVVDFARDALFFWLNWWLKINTLHCSVLPLGGKYWTDAHVVDCDVHWVNTNREFWSIWRFQKIWHYWQKRPQNLTLFLWNRLGPDSVGNGRPWYTAFCFVRLLWYRCCLKYCKQCTLPRVPEPMLQIEKTLEESINLT